MAGFRSLLWWLGRLASPPSEDHVLQWGHTYSVQVQVKDAIQAHVYTADRRAYIHTNPAVGKPTLTAAADTNHLAPVTLAWGAVDDGDGDTMTYEVEVTRADGLKSSYQTTATSIALAALGKAAIGDVSWRVRATDEHGAVGSWSTADVFAVIDGGAVPTCTLVSAPAYLPPLVTYWRYFDADGDPQSHYQVQLASDAEYADIVETSGEVASAALHHQHTTTAAATYYRRARVKSGGTWSAWATDTITITAPTAQAEEMAVYRDAAGEPTLLGDAYPVSGLTINLRSNMASECRFVVNNFDGAEAGISDQEELLVYLKDSDGKRVTFRGRVTNKQVGDMLEVTAKDIAHLFDFWRVKRRLSHVTLGELITAIVEDPTGRTPTGIVCHAQEVATDYGVYRVASFDGAGKTLSGCLADFAAATGYEWTVRYTDGAYHLYWYDPTTQPLYPVTLKDNIDRAANSATQWRISDDIRVGRDSICPNRIVYTSVPDPLYPETQPDFDQAFTEALTDWGRAETTYTTEHRLNGYYWDADYGLWRTRGAYGLAWQYNRAYGTGTAWPAVLPICYRRLPAELRDLYRATTGRVVFDYKLTVNDYFGNAGHPAVDSYGGHSSTQYRNKPSVRLRLYILCSEDAIAHMAEVPLNGFYSDGESFAVDCTPPSSWNGVKQEAGFPMIYTWQEAEFPLPWVHIPGAPSAEPYRRVIALGVGVTLDGYWKTPAGVVYPTLSADATHTVRLGIDNLRIEPWGDSMAPTERYVETEAVTAGTTPPLEVMLDTQGLNYSAARELASLMLARRSAVRPVVQSGGIDGIRNVPVGARVPLALPNHGLASTTLSVSEVVYSPLDSGDTTQLTLGAPGERSGEVVRTMATVRQKLDGLLGAGL